MKKTFLTTLILIILLISAPVFAKPGDIAGEYYCTDIKTYLNGAQIDSINIGGQTLINAEAMYYYSFNVQWNEDARTLYIWETRDTGNGTPPAVETSQFSVGTPLGYYYETDIITYLDNVPITAYNTGGKTYILVREMQNLGYVVNWYEAERKVEIISPIRAGYVYDMGLSYYNENKYPDNMDDKSICAFSIRYTRSGLTGTDDADLFDLTLHSNGKEYMFTASFYQNEGLYNSTALIEKLTSLCYDGFSVQNPCDKSEKYDFVNQNVSIFINGQKAEKINVTSGVGNGHRDFYFTAEDLPAFTKDEINEIIISVGQPSGESYEITVPDYVVNSPDTIAETLKKYPNDYMQTYYEANDYYLFFMKESESLGIVKDRLYIVNKTTHEVSEDLLEQVRIIDGFNYDLINPFAFKTDETGSNFFFSCHSPEKTMDFYAELDTATVHAI